MKTGPASFLPALPQETYLHQINGIFCVSLKEVHWEIPIRGSGVSVSAGVPGNHREELLVQVLNLRSKICLSTAYQYKWSSGYTAVNAVMASNTPQQKQKRGTR